MPKQDAIPAKFAPGYLDRLDGRTAVAVDMRQRWQEITNDLGGEATLSYAQRSLIERALWLEHWLAMQERILAEGGDFNAANWTQASNALLGLWRTLGLERKARDVTDLSSYLRRKAEAG